MQVYPTWAPTLCILRNNIYPKEANEGHLIYENGVIGGAADIVCS
jgi:hypothetical protein